MKRIWLKFGREKSLYYRHPWIFSGAILKMDPKIDDGKIVEILKSDGKFLARGYYNSRSNIALRVLSWDENEPLDEGFFRRKILKASALREAFVKGKDLDAYRLVFAEGDGLPGLIIDKYGDYFCLQISTLGMEMWKDVIVKVLEDLFEPKGIYERSDSGARHQDGLPGNSVGLLSGKWPDDGVKINEYGVKFLVDCVNGQKTGFFLDQRENRAALEKYVRDKKVLNLFSYSGGFSCVALAHGAKKVTSVDSSASAVEMCKNNMKLNGFSSKVHEEVVADVFEYLDEAYSNGVFFDVVIVDPPAFVKSKKSLENALKAYAKLNEKALRVLGPEGILVSSSCSSYVTPELFQQALFQAALRTGDNLVLLEQKTQPFDHPNTLFFPEGEYLKFFVLQKYS